MFHYLGELTQPACAMYGEALMSDMDEKVVRAFEGVRAIGRREFSVTLKLERGRYRVRGEDRGLRSEVWHLMTSEGSEWGVVEL